MATIEQIEKWMDEENTTVEILPDGTVVKTKLIYTRVEQESKEEETTTGEDVQETLFRLQCHSFRNGILNIAKDVKALMGHEEFKGIEAYPGQGSEMKANIMLTYRHLEDARMRIGKILQAADDGISIIDKTDSKGN